MTATDWPLRARRGLSGRRHVLLTHSSPLRAPLPAPPSARLAIQLALLLLVALLGLSTPACRQPLPPSDQGLVLTSVRPRSALERAGLVVGDQVAAWRFEASDGNDASNRRREAIEAAPKEGDLRSHLDLHFLEIELAPLGTVELVGSRNGQPLRVTVPAGRWQGAARPLLHETADRELTSALEQIRQGGEAGGEENELAAAWAIVEELVEGALAGDDAQGAVALLEVGGRALADARSPELAAPAYRRAIAAAEDAGLVRHQAYLLDAFGDRQRRWSRFEDAFESHRQALALQEAQAANGLAVAYAHNRLGMAASYRGDFAAAMESLGRAESIYLELAPNSLALAENHHQLGNNAWESQELADAEAHHRRALELRSALTPDSFDVALSSASLGNVYWTRGDLPAAEVAFEHALELMTELDADASYRAMLLGSLGNVANDRGDHAEARRFRLESLQIFEQQSPHSINVAHALHNLGITAKDQHDYDAAEDYHRRALELYEQSAPGSFHAARALMSLGNVYFLLDDDERAEAHYRRALALFEAAQGQELHRSRALTAMSSLAFSRQELETAESRLREALAITTQDAPGSLLEGMQRRGLGLVLLEQGRLAAAEVELRRSLAIAERLAPDTRHHALPLHSLGTILRRRNDLEGARRYYAQAVTVLEAQIDKLGASAEGEASFRARHLDVYREYLDLLIDMADEQAAFEVLERVRGHVFLAQLAERDLQFAEVPEALDRERRLADRQYDQAQKALQQLSASSDDAVVDEAVHRLQSTARQRAEIRDRIREVAPRFAQLRYAEPLNFAAARAALDPGTLALAYSVSDNETHLFALDDTGLTVTTLGIGDAELRQHVERLRTLIEAGGKGAAGAAFVDQAQKLYELLLEPLAPQIEEAERVLLLLDGPLHYLPFGALVRQTPTGPQYLVEWKPLHRAASLTVYLQLLRERQAAGDSERGGGTLYAFADPDYAGFAPTVAGSATATDPSSTVLRDLSFAPLPGTRTEVRAIADIHRGRSQLYIGPDATEARVLALPQSTNYLHFAVHAFLDERFPLNSGLALSAPGDGRNEAEAEENGLLQVWEILERLRIDADLVSLSACETALGEEVPGAGIVGLTRAFHHAGAHSVLSSLWRVSDRSTAALMTRFYDHLSTGLTKDEALQAAQIDLLQGPLPAILPSSPEATGGWWQRLTRTLRGSGNDEPDVSEPIDARHPFHWAAFQLSGDWR